MSDKIRLIDVKTDDITDFKETSILLVFPFCSGKCGKSCHNYKLIGQNNYKEYNINSIVNLYNRCSMHNAVVCAGLEPFDSFDELKLLVKQLFLNRKKSVSLVIYTGYELSEIKNKVEQLINLVQGYPETSKSINNKLFIKFGRYEKDKKEYWYSTFLGVELATSNQYVILADSYSKTLLKQSLKGPLCETSSVDFTTCS